VQRSSRLYIEFQVNLGCLKKQQKTRLEGLAQVVNALPSKCKASANPITTRKRKERKKTNAQNYRAK
jgi:hypothetical protein